MLKKILILGVAVGGFATATLIPLSASAARVKTEPVTACAPGSSNSNYCECPPGSSNSNYCIHVRRCVVPELQGVPLNKAVTLLFKHDCTLGKIHILRSPPHHYGNGTPTTATPTTNTPTTATPTTTTTTPTITTPTTGTPTTTNGPTTVTVTTTTTTPTPTVTYPAGTPKGKGKGKPTSKSKGKSKGKSKSKKSAHVLVRSTNQSASWSPEANWIVVSTRPAAGAVLPKDAPVSLWIVSPKQGKQGKQGNQGHQHH